MLGIERILVSDDVLSKRKQISREDSILELLLNARLASTTIWKPVHEKLPDFISIQHPDQLQAVGQIPMKRPMTELGSWEDLVEDTTGSCPNWL